MSRKILILVASLVVLACILGACGSSATSSSGTAGTQTSSVPSETSATTGASGGSLTLRLTTEWEAGDARNDLIDELVVKPFNEAAAGRATLELYASGELAKGLDAVDAVNSRLVDLAVTKLTGGWPKIVPELTVLSLSVFDNAEHTYRALDGELGAALDKAMQEKANATIISYLTAGEVEAMGAVNKDIKTIDDISGLKMRVSSKTEAVCCEALKGIPTIIDSSEMYLALQRGTVEGVFITVPASVLKTKTIEVCKHWTQIPIVSGIQMGLVANLAAWNELPADLRETLTEAAKTLSDQMAASTRQSSDEAWDQIRSTPGATVYTVPEDEAAGWIEAMKPAQLSLLEEAVPADTASELLELVAAAR